MHRRKLGELEVSAIGLGCATMTPFYGEPASALATLRRALDLGVDFLDISDAHGGGRGEELVAAAIAGRRERAVIASKFGNLRRPNGTQAADGRPEYVKMACENSLRRLETEVIDLYYIHRIDRSVPIEDTVGAISDLARAGKMRFLGISEAAPATIRRAHTVHPMTTVQIEYLLLTRPVPREPWSRRAPIGRRARSPAVVRRAGHRLCRLQPAGVRFSDRHDRRPRGARGQRRAPPHAALHDREPTEKSGSRKLLSMVIQNGGLVSVS
jgi:aryl-alcohol dehydrogenase-like predicted oxidoreductase